MSTTIALVPELCNMTGLTDQMKADFKVMKDVAQFTRVTPTQRQEVSFTCLLLTAGNPHQFNFGYSFL